MNQQIICITCGTQYTQLSACATSDIGIIDAFTYIRLNKADMMITGGSEAPITKRAVGGFNASKTLSTYNDAPQQAARLFDVLGDGLVIGEGAVALILEELEYAKKSGVKVLVEIVRGGMAADAYYLTGTLPEG